MERRTQLNAWDKRLLARIRRGRWSADELKWVLSHLDERAPTLIIQEIHDKLMALRGQPNATSHRMGQIGLVLTAWQPLTVGSSHGT
jgi:hypothetical protein